MADHIIRDFDICCGRGKGPKYLSYSKREIRTGRNKQKLKLGTLVHALLLHHSPHISIYTKGEIETK